jgi:hypothetical protein
MAASRPENPSNAAGRLPTPDWRSIVPPAKVTITPHCERLEALLIEFADEIPVVAVAMPID